MASIVGSGAVTIFPVMTGFKKAIGSGVKSAGAAGAKSFRNAFNMKSAGAELGTDLKKAFKTASGDMGVEGLSKFKKDVASASDAASRAHMKEKDAAGQVRVAEAKLAEAVKKYGADSSQAIAAEERLNSAKRKHEQASSNLAAATGKLKTAQADLAAAQKSVLDQAEKAPTAFQKFTAGVKSATSRVGAGIKSLATVSVGAAATGIAALAPALFSTGKAALSAYATYEQAVGGVDTLFKSSSKTVQKYASQAYATAGVSANSYMEQITSFSASLISSLGGDTAKAAEVGNQAVIDMSDNANKMGTNLDSIQQTYQSIARGNYAMLDNLKLGYGGTKTEMQRLLKDAQKLTGVKYDISNFADVTQAIHAVQTNLGITGTTAKEAADTIEGSTAAMKSAWQNWLTELGKSDADMSGLTGQLTTSIGNVLKNVLPRVGVIAKSVVKSIPSLFGQLSTLLPAPFQKGIDAIGGLASRFKSVLAPMGAAFTVLGVSGLGPVVSKLPVVGKLFTGLATKIPILGKAFTMLTGPVGMIGAALIATTPELRTAFGAALGEIFATLGASISQLMPVISTFVTSLQTSVNMLLPPIIAAIGMLVPPLTSLITGLLPPLIGIIAGLIPPVQTIIGVVTQIATTLLNMLIPIISSLMPTITSVITGIIPIIQSLIPVVSMILDSFATVVTALSPILGNLASIIGVVVKLAASYINDVLLPNFKAMLPTIKSVVASVTNVVKAISTVIAGVVNVVAGIFSGDWSRVWTGAKQIVTGAIDGIKSIIDGAKNIGSNLVKGIWSGISNVAGWLKNKIFGFAKGVTDSIKNFFGIHSPSKLWAKEVGAFLPPGIAVGIEGSAPQLYSTVKDMTAKATSIASDAARGVQAAVNGSIGVDSPQPGSASYEQQGTTVNQYITTPEVDPRLQARQWAREYEKARAGIA